MNSRVGEKIIDNYGVEIEIIEYINCRNIKVRFNDEFKAIINTRYDCFLDKRIKNPYRKSFLGVGYIGVGKYSSKNTKIMNCWNNMLKRCYKEDSKDITYDDCIVCEEWHNFQNFAEWYEENYYEVDGKPTFLDKDILYKGNKIYSPQTCVFVPRLINNLFTKRQNERGLYPIGVEPYKDTNKFISIISETHRYAKTKRTHLGIRDTVEETFNLYKVYKEKLIKDVADEYKNDIPKNLYYALYNYKVEITD